MWPFRRKTAPQRVTPSIPFIGAEAWALGSSSTYVSPQAAQALAAVTACVNLISETIASLPAAVVLSDNTREDVPNHPLTRLIDQGCNANETWSDLLTQLVASALLNGNGVTEIETDGAGRLSGLVSVPWPTITPFVGSDGALLFNVLPMSPPGAGKPRTLLRDDVVLLKDRGDGNLLGISRLQRAANALQHALETQRGSFQFLANQARPSGTLTAPGKLSKETAARLAQDWDLNYSQNGRGKTAVLPEGLQFVPLSLQSAGDQQVVERLRYTVEDIARVFSVPLYLLGDPNRATFASAREATINFTRSLMPWIAKIERSFSQTVLAPQYRLHLDATALIKADPTALADALAKYRQAGILSPNDARSEIGYPSVDGGDDLAPPNTSAAAVVDPGATPTPKGLQLTGRPRYTNGHDRRAH